MEEEFYLQGNDEWIRVSQENIDRLTALSQAMLTLEPPMLSTTYIRRVILGLDDDKPKFKYGK